MGRRKTTYEFIKDAINKHGDKYDYSLVDYLNNKTPVSILCKYHKKIFNQRPDNHLKGSGCPYCKSEKTSKKQLSTLDIFIEKSINKHGNKYDYSLVEYVNSSTKVKIICKKHKKVFEQKPNSHLNGRGCPLCAGNIKLTIDDFIKRSINKHGNKYDYSLVEYINPSTKVKIICKKHKKSFEQRPHNHMLGDGCPLCNNSKGEDIITKYLIDNNINFISQKTFNECVYKYKLRFDFYLSEYNTCIEYDGKQHFEVNEFFGGESGFIETQKRDKIKNKYCKSNNINLIRIRYDEKIEDKIKNIGKREL